MWQVLAPLFTIFTFLSSFSFIFGLSVSAFQSVPATMRFSHVLRALPALAQGANCSTKLYVSSYSGNITTFSLDRTTANVITLKNLGVTQDSAPQAAWLELNSKAKVVYGVDEAWSTPNGSITTYNTTDGALVPNSKHVTYPGAVSTVLYNGGKAVACAHYGGQVLTTWATQADGSLSNIGDFVFTQEGPGAYPERQDKPHPHEALVDPTDSYILVPDLGSDLLRTFSIDKKTSKLKELTPFPVKPGNGPRHGAFYAPTAKPGPKGNMVAGDGTYFLLVNELSNTVESYKVKYGKSGLGFKLVESHGIYGTMATPAGAAAAEGKLSPDLKFFHTSSRNATILTTPNPNPLNTTAIPSDTLQTWIPDPNTGKLTFVESAAAGGRFPRQFSLNKKGDLAAVGLQQSSRFVILPRDIATGKFGEPLASVENLGEVTAVIWDEK
ncbi:putative 6-phosphogluconolactonase [Amylocarpus encephaloides]|uniref:6-phosphogluconolactonase n=1 Tax=Amylocarpus encephaloides TaxID=45428 RepID=A0A9P7YF58_9HELO|nr:putative 6-phosphogluconolactonase [Amylocarpus encephaloides]